jgi:hypothetical protein
VKALQLIVKNFHRLDFHWSRRPAVLLVTFVCHHTDRNSSGFGIPIMRTRTRKECLSSDIGEEPEASLQHVAKRENRNTYPIANAQTPAMTTTA